MDEDLREAALIALGTRSKLARRALSAGLIALENTGEDWESSHGHVSAMRVVLGVDATTLAEIDRSPIASRELERALGTAFAARPRASMIELQIRWRPASANRASYREAPTQHGETISELADALREYLAAAGHDAIVAALGDPVLSLSRTQVMLRDDHVLSAPQRRIVTDALHRLLEPRPLVIAIS